MRPQFNLDSAEKLLAEFEIRAGAFPCRCFAICYGGGRDGRKDGEELNIAALARRKPFVLLAILACC